MTCEERNAMLREEVIAWIRASEAAIRLINEQRARLAAIARIAGDRIAATSSTDEAAVLWAIVHEAENGRRTTEETENGQ